MSIWNTPSLQAIADAWNGYTNYQGAEEFMRESRAKLGADCTIEQAVADYVAEIARDWPDEGDAALMEEETARVRADLVAYLEISRGSEWDIPANA